MQSPARLAFLPFLERGLPARLARPDCGLEAALGMSLRDQQSRIIRARRLASTRNP